MDCPFCCPTPERVFHGSDPAFICLWDGFAVSPGHALVVPRRHVATWFEASFEEQVALLRGIEIGDRALIVDGASVTTIDRSGARGWSWSAPERTTENSAAWPFEGGALVRTDRRFTLLGPNGEVRWTLVR